jgi:hypothetical protein
LNLNCRLNARCVRVICISAFVGVLHACGGGGGTSPSPGGGTEPTSPPGGGGSATVSGTVWHNSLATDANKRSKLSVFGNSATRAVDAKPTAVPSSNGRQYVTWDYDFRPGKDSTTLELKETSTGAVLQTVTFTGYVRDPRPSPLNSNIVLVRWSSQPSANDAEQVIVDLSKRQIVETLGGEDVAANWLSDGRYLLLLANGNLFTASPGGTRTANGKAFVAGRLPVGLWVSPLGDQMLTQWRTVQGDKVLKDLWISSLNGDNLARFTSSEVSQDAVWSYDGNFVGYTNEPERVCTGFSCGSASCDVKYAPANSRGLTEFDSRASDFRVPDTESKAVILGCRINGWTS